MQIYASQGALSTFAPIRPLGIFDLERHKVYGGLIFALFIVAREQFDSNSTPTGALWTPSLPPPNPIKNVCSSIIFILAGFRGGARP